MQEQLPRRSKRKYLAFGCENPIKKTVATATHRYIFQYRKSDCVISVINLTPKTHFEQHQ
ncbi:hybrid sensor histidine kinase/response regulator [Methylovulum psychrotolerans]|uniref:Hybrid sensor histidine kinase/response regulator n=1 Tax=Methylovulum psychrotolerans TaxID=1704499 RepID=A0A2S5CNK2_9GAMM|nr:hybrid sensor histidine kinase/response regulator [Methylovulum psychrotolerans]